MDVEFEKEIKGDIRLLCKHLEFSLGSLLLMLRTPPLLLLFMMTPFFYPASFITRIMQMGLLSFIRTSYFLFQDGIRKLESTGDYSDISSVHIPLVEANRIFKQYSHELYNEIFKMANTEFQSLVRKKYNQIKEPKMPIKRGYRIYFLVVYCCLISEDIIRLKELLDESNIIRRSIEFSPEYYQSGITILNYFSKFLYYKYKSKKVKVRIEQEGLKVSMTIESPEGERERIERYLEDYGLVVFGKKPIEQFISEEWQIIELKNNLEIAKMQLKLQQRIMDAMDSKKMDLESQLAERNRILAGLFVKESKRERGTTLNS